MVQEPGAVRLVHITTVPLSLMFLRGQVGYMQARGFSVHAVSSPGELLDDFARREGVATFAVEMPRRITPFRDLLAIARLWRYLRRVRPHIVHAHTPKGGLLGMVSAWLARAPVRIYHMRGLPLETATGWRRTLLRWSERLSCRLAHRVLCVSHSLRALAVAERLCPPEKIRVLAAGSGNGVDAAERFNPAHLSASARTDSRAAYGIPATATVVGYVGRLVGDKGLVELAAAWQTVRQSFPDLHLLLVGPWEPQDPVPPDVETLLRTDARVHLTGHVRDVAPLYAAMDLLVLPSYREGFPNTLLEAAAMGLPVVATRVPGCVDAVADGVTGTLVPPRDPDTLASAIAGYLADPGRREAHGRAGRERVLREFRPEDIWAALHREYQDLLQRKGLAGSQPCVH